MLMVLICLHKIITIMDMSAINKIQIMEIMETITITMMASTVRTTGMNIKMRSIMIKSGLARTNHRIIMNKIIGITIIITM